MTSTIKVDIRIKQIPWGTGRKLDDSESTDNSHHWPSIRSNNKIVVLREQQKEIVLISYNSF